MRIVECERVIDAGRRNRVVECKESDEGRKMRMAECIESDGGI